MSYFRMARDLQFGGNGEVKCLCYQLDILAQNDFLVILGVTNHSILWIRLCGCLRNPVITSWKRSVVFTFHYIFITRVSTCFNHPQPSAVENGGNHPMNGPIPFIYTIYVVYHHPIPKSHEIHDFYRENPWKSIARTGTRHLDDIMVDVQHSWDNGTMVVQQE